MTAIDFGLVKNAETTAERSKRPRLLRKLLILFRRQGRAVGTYLELSRLDERLLYDIGIDPLDVRDALHNQRSPSILLEPMRIQFELDRNPKHGSH